MDGAEPGSVPPFSQPPADARAHDVFKELFELAPDASEDLRQLARELRHSFGVAADDIRFVFNLANADLGIDVAVPSA